MEKVKSFMRRFGKLIAAVICFFLVQFAEVGGYYLFMYAPFGGDLGGEVVGAIAVTIAICALGGSAMYKLDWAKIGESFRITWWTLAVSAGLMAISVFEIIAGGELASNWTLMMVYTLVFCLGVGFLEEGLLRGLILEGLLAVFGSKKVGIILCVLLSTVLFGVMHIDFFSLDTSDSMQMTQAILKVAQTGIFGFCLAAAVVDTGNIVGVALVHALDDFMLMLPTMALLGDTTMADYVSADEAEGVATITLYVVICVLYLPLFISAVRVLWKTKAPNLGTLVHETPAAGLPQGQAVVAGQPAFAEPVAGVPYAGQPLVEQPIVEQQVVEWPAETQSMPQHPAGQPQPPAQVPVQVPMQVPVQPQVQVPMQAPAQVPVQTEARGNTGAGGAPPRPKGL